MTVEKRPVAYEELKEFSEIGACGTAVVLTPVNEIVRGNDIIRVGPQTGCGPVLQKLYEQVKAIQYGEMEDTHGWTLPVTQRSVSSPVA
jgi:branched-chain amino acid aminotransferase